MSIRLPLTLVVMLLAALAAVACGSPKAAGPTQSPQPAASATAASTPAPTPPSPPQVLAVATATFLTSVAAGVAGARSDCPNGWLAYRDRTSKLSLCAPVGLTAIADVAENGAPGILVTASVVSRK